MCSCRYYGVFAVNARNPNDILGYVEHSISMGWSRRFVNVMSGFRMHDVDVAVAKRMLDFKVNGKGSLPKGAFMAWFRECCPSLYKDGMSTAEAVSEYEKRIRETESGALLAQHVWNWQANVIKVPDGYEVKIFRLNSANCPVDADFRYRTAYDRRRISKWNKWKYRNAPFIVKALNPGRTVFDFYPTVESVLDANEACVEFRKYAYRVKRTVAFSEQLKKNAACLSRKKKKILKKQRINSVNRFFAEKGAKGGQALPNGQG